MADRVTVQKRSEIMSRVRQKNTEPELAVRRFLYGLGYRYRLHRRDLAGSPDIVFQRRRKIIFVHGCFWHGHECRKSLLPKSNVTYWRTKLSRNKQRDADNIAKLMSDGWGVLVLWSCGLKNIERLQIELTNFLGPAGVRQLLSNPKSD